MYVSTLFVVLAMPINHVCNRVLIVQPPLPWVDFLGPPSLFNRAKGRIQKRLECILLLSLFYFLKEKRTI